jgi:hypothetical protein
VWLENAAYGKLCTIVPTLINSLQGIVIDAIGAADASLHETAQRLRTVAGSYRDADRVNEENFRRIEPGP